MCISVGLHAWAGGKLTSLLTRLIIQKATGGGTKSYERCHVSYITCIADEPLLLFM
jgi:hypothetical protein